MLDLSSKKLFVFDMDGTIYLGNTPFPEAISLIKRLRSEGKSVLFFTNNASNTANYYKEKLLRLGFEPQEGEIMTSGDVTAAFLNKNRKGSRVFLVGTPALCHSFTENGITLTAGDEADIVVTSFDTTLTYEKLSKACNLIRCGAEYFSTHPDFNCPTENGFIPDSGAIAAFVTASTGVTPRYFGKPYPEAMDMICKVTGQDKRDVCIIGDRLYTDIKAGKQSGVTAVLVLTGETKKEDLLHLNSEGMPDIVFESTLELQKAVFGN